MGWRTVLLGFLLLSVETVAMQKDGDKEKQSQTWVQLNHAWM